MNVLILTNTKKDLKPYLAQLERWGMTYQLDNAPTEQGKKESERDYGIRITADVRKKYGDTVDLVQVVFTTKDWPLDSNISGKQYNDSFNDYQLAFVKEGRDCAGTATHENAHSWDNLCWIYLGVNLSQVVGVNDWDDDIVHRRDPKTHKYLQQYDDVYAVVRPYLDRAIAKRRTLNLLNLLLAEYRKLLLLKEAEEITTTPMKTNAELLYETAYSCLGKDMSDRAPNELGCADSVNNVFEKAFGSEIGGGVSTNALFHALEGDSRFEKVTTARMGDIIMCPTGYSTKGAKNGHVGIIGRNVSKTDGSLWVMSNDSFKGTWEANYTVKSWNAYFGKQLGFPVHIYRLK